MATLSSPQQSKYASFEPEQPEEEQTQVDSLQITFEDLETGKTRTKEVFCDPESWRPRSDLRFLISSDLVNLLTESHLTRKARAKCIHEKLAQCRAAFLCDLWRLRGLADRLLRADIEEESPRSLQLNDICNVHYYVPELYFDDWTQHRLNKANHGFEEKIKAETNQLKAYLIRLGGGTWKNLLWYALRFNTVMEVGKQLMDSIKDEAKRKHVENMVTGGLWDKMDQLTPIVDVLDATMEEFESNQEEFEKENVAQVQAIEFCTKRKNEVEDLIEAEDPQLPPDSDTDPEEEAEDEDEDDVFAEYKPTEEGEDPELLSMIAAATSSGKKAPSKLEVETMKKKLKQKRQAEEKAKKQEQEKQEEERLQQEQIQRMLEAWEEKARVITEELNSLEAPLQQLEVETMEQLGDEVKRPEQAARLLEERAAEMEKNAQKAAKRAEELEAQVLKAEQQVSTEQGFVKELHAQVKDLPPPDPRILIFSQLKLELKRLTRELEPRKAFIKQVKDRIKAIRYEMRILYQKLGWDWDLSESEDDGEEKPYWVRRKMAIDGPMGFDERKFLYKENDFKGRRLKKRTMKERSRVESSLVAQLQAKGRTRIDNIEGMEERNKILPFAANEGRDIVELEDVLSRSKGSKRHLRQNKDDTLKQASAGGYPRSTNQALYLQLLDVAKERLKSCSSCFINLLPEEGQLAEFRPRAEELVAQLNKLSDEALQAEEKDDVERTLEELVAAFQGLIGEALGLSRTDPFVSALKHSFDFGELRKRTSEVHTSQKQLQLATTPAGSKSRTNTKPSLRHARTQGDMPSHSNPQDLSSFILASPRLKPLETVGEHITGGGSGSDGSLAKRKDENRQVADLGFALNGTAQGSLENWSLFKVNKRSGEESASSSAAGSTRTAAQTGEDAQVPESKAVRLRRATTDYDFKDYMAQLQDSKELSRNASLPSLRPELRKGPSLPELIRKGSASELVCQERKGQRLRHSVTTSAIDASSFSKFFTASRW